MATGLSAVAALRAAAVKAVQRAFSAIVWFVLLALAGASLLVCGTYLLAGMGWAMVVGGAICTLLAFVLLIGMSRGG